MEVRGWLFVVLVVLGISFLESTVINGDIQSRTKRNAACGGVLAGASGTFSLPLVTCTHENVTFPCYSKNFQCQWTISAPAGQIVMLRADDFFLEDSDECEFDYVEVVEENGSSIRFCGWEPVMFMSITQNLIINFNSDDTFDGAGFTFEYRTYAADTFTHCNTSIVGGPGGVLFNNDKSDLSCFYAIQAPPDKVVKLDLRMIQFGSNTCEEESLRIYPGLTIQRTAEITVCSNRVTGLISEKYNAVFIEYRNIIGSEQERFELVYSYEDEPPPPAPLPPSKVGGDPDCSHLFTNGKRWTWTSPKYEEKRHCIVVVRNRHSNGEVIQVTFEKFHLEKIVGCVYDNFTIKSGARKDSPSLGGPYCGKSLLGKTLVTYGNSMRMEFKTDESLSWEGILAHIKIVKPNACDNEVCQQGHVCVKRGYEKVCKKGKECVDNDYCFNGGTCVKTKNAKQCFCPDGFTGPDCSQGDGSGPLNVKGPPNRRVKKGDEVFERCTADNVKSIEWLSDAGQVIGDYSSNNKFGVRTSGALQIDDITDDQEGTYTCIVHTDIGTAEHSFEIKVMDKCRVDFRDRPDKQVTKRTGDKVVFECSAKLVKNIHWEKADTANAPFKTLDTSVSKYEVIPTEMNGISTSSLEINDAQKEDEGVYRCVVESTLNDCYSHRQGELSILTVQPYLKHCGISRHDEIANAKVFKGEDARPGEFPWQVTLRKPTTNGDSIAFCGGSLITNQHVLTAAHCINDTEGFSAATVTMLFGTTDCARSKITRHPKAFETHPDYGKIAKYDSDIAIITLNSPVEFGDDIRAICFDTEHNYKKMFFQKASSRASPTGTIAGCGKILKTHNAKTLQISRLPYVPDCQEHVDEWNEGGKGKKNPITLTDNMMCAGYKDRLKTDACKGDSGGPLIMHNSGQWFQTGIVSFGGTCGKHDVVGFYTNVGAFYDWIDKKTSFTTSECEDCDWAYE